MLSEPWNVSVILGRYTTELRGVHCPFNILNIIIIQNMVWHSWRREEREERREEINERKKKKRKKQSKTTNKTRKICSLLLPSAVCCKVTIMQRTRRSKIRSWMIWSISLGISSAVRDSELSLKKIKKNKQLNFKPV